MDTTKESQDGRYRFDESRHIHYLDNRPLMGTTTVLRVIAKPALVPWSAKMTTEYIQNNCNKNPETMDYQVSEDDLKLAKVAHRQKKDDAADWGTIVHKAIEVWIKTKLVPTEVVIKDKVVMVLPEHNVAIDNFIKWATDNQVAFIRTEQGIYSEDWMVGGIVDFVCTIDGQLIVGDIKTSSDIWEEYWLQCACYSKMMVEMGWHKRFDAMTIVNLRKDGTVKVETRENIKENVKVFEAALCLHKRFNQ